MTMPSNIKHRKDAELQQDAKDFVITLCMRRGFPLKQLDVDQLNSLLEKARDRGVAEGFTATANFLDMMEKHDAAAIVRLTYWREAALYALRFLSGGG